MWTFCYVMYLCVSVCFNYLKQINSANLVYQFYLATSILKWNSEFGAHTEYNIRLMLTLTPVN